MTFGMLARLTTVAVVISLTSVAQAQSPADFYKGKNVELYIGYSVGGGYDLYARVLARHIGQHIPGNPTIVVKNMEGAGSLRLAPRADNFTSESSRSVKSSRFPA